MIYFVTGDSVAGAGREKVQKTAQGLVAALQKKRPGALLFRMSADDWDQNTFDGIATGQGLFENKYIVVLDSLFNNEQAAEFFDGAGGAPNSALKNLKTADHAFVFVEYAPKAPVKNLLKKFAEKTWEVSGEKNSFTRPDFNIFSLTDALGDRNRARLWTLYQKALMAGNEPEAIHGILFWQVKSLLAAAQSKTAADADLKPFVWSKNQKFLKNYSLPELRKISGEMVGLYHLSRLESVPLEVLLEEFVLGDVENNTCAE